MSLSSLLSYPTHRYCKVKFVAARYRNMVHKPVAKAAVLCKD